MDHFGVFGLAGGSTGALFDRLGGPLGRLEAILSHLRPSWRHLGPFRRPWSPVRSVLDGLPGQSWNPWRVSGKRHSRPGPLWSR
eukprot:4000802-Pyramimonas_sp.AAC.1